MSTVWITCGSSQISEGIFMAMKRALLLFILSVGWAAAASAADFPKAPGLQPSATSGGGGPWTLNRWDQDVDLPAGIYRGNGGKIDLEKEHKFTVAPGSLIEKVKFAGNRGPVWSVAGSFLREVEFSGDLGLNFSAVDSAFEDVEMKKTGGWFVDRWSTKWRFENCVFGEKLMGTRCGVGDYGIIAERCTFYKIELPMLAYKDPSIDAQSDKLKFADCRFVNCSVPESFLAATVNCVFEDCHFGKREDWSKSKGPVSVLAYVTGPNNPPANYENGNLKVEFKSGNPVAGAKLPVTNTGGRLAMQGLRTIGQPIAIGTLPAAPKVATATPAAGTPTPASKVATQPTPAPNGNWSGAGDLLKKYHNSLVFVSGPTGAGSGFIAGMAGANYLFTNAHVAAGVRGAAFKTLEGAPLQPGAASVAVGHDIFRMAMATSSKPFEIMQGVDENAAIDDEIVVLGNAEGAGVINTIKGKIVGIGPNLVEVDAPFVPGNSGSPIIHLKSGKVIGVATYLIIKKYDPATNEPVKDPVVRRFGYRLDSVRQWQNVNWQAFYAQAGEMEKIESLTDDLGNFLGDLAKDKHVTPGAYSNPVIKAPIDAWVTERSRRLSPTDLSRVNQNFLSFLKIACQSDINTARTHMTYDYFQRDFADQQQTRGQMAEIFVKLIKSN